MTLRPLLATHTQRERARSLFDRVAAPLEQEHVAPDAMQLAQPFAAAYEAAGIWTIQTGIFSENEASLRVHERAGFEIVASPVAIPSA